MDDRRNKLFSLRWKIIPFLLLIFLIGNYQQIKAEDVQQNIIHQSEREIPVVKTVDVVIIGGTVPAVAAAVSAAENGATVFLVAPRPFLGEDLCATLRLRIDTTRKLKTSLEKQIFGNAFLTTPLKVKAILNKALLNANVDFTFGSFVTDVLWNEKHDPAGVIITNRAGRQAIIAKTIIDASDRGWVCRMAGAETLNWADHSISFERTVIMPGQNVESPIYVTHELEIPMSDLHFPSFAKAEIIAREITYTDEQLRASESLFHIPPDPLICKKNSRDWNQETREYIGHFQPKGCENIFVLSGSAGIPRSVADSLLKPAAMAETGSYIGKAAAKIAKQKQFPKKLIVKNISANKTTINDISDLLNGFRPTDNNLPSIKLQYTSLPIIANYDIVVVGGGTSGAPAAIAAARWGMKVLVVEYQEGLGGVGTLGLIGKPYHGRKVGFAAEVPFPEDNIEPKMEWYRSEIKKAGGDIWLGVLGCGAYLDGNQIGGAVISTPEGRDVVTANVVIDATGNADIAIAAGAEYMYGDIEKNDIALQGTGFPSRPLNGNYLNTDYLLVDEMDMVDVWRTLVSVHQTKYAEDIFDVGTLIQSRERHRIVGVFVMNYLDQLTGRTFPDAIVFSGSDYDSHGYPSSPYFAMLPHDEVSRKENHPAPGGTCYTPYRCLIPKNLNGILVTGLGISMERDASAMIRMQLDVANQGYAAGVAASLAIASDKNLREIDIKQLQQYLVDKGNLPEAVLKQKDSYPLSRKTINQAVVDYGKATNPQEAGKPLAIILTHKKTALPLISREFRHSSGKNKLLYAQVLCMCGKKEGVNILLNELENVADWDEKIFQGSMADFAHLPTPIDAMILALGNSGDKAVISRLLELVDKLDSNVTLSHHRSLALALEKISDPIAAQSIAELLQKPGMQGHALHSIEDAFTQLHNNGKGPNPVNNSSLDKRTKALREIVLARALYKCGDYNGIGENILINYTKDMRGLFSLHAHQILQK